VQLLRNSFIPKGRFPEALLREASKKNEIIPCGAAGRALMRDTCTAVMATCSGFKISVSKWMFFIENCGDDSFFFFISSFEKRGYRSLTCGVPDRVMLRQKDAELLSLSRLLRDRVAREPESFVCHA